MTLTPGPESSPTPASTPGSAPGSTPTTPWTRFLALPRGLRLASYGVVALVLTLVAVTLVGVVLVRRSLPQTTGELEVPGLAGPVEVLRDDAGVAQVYADTTEDLFLAQGFVAAQERFYEMDVRRHAASGRLAELFGPDAVESDAYVRTLGWRGVAEAELPLLTPETRTALDSYADGVNAFLAERSTTQLSLEYVALGAGGLDYAPEPWSAVDSLVWLKASAWDLAGNLQDEIDRVAATAAVGAARAAELWPDYPATDVEPVVGQGAVVDGVFEQDASVGGTRNPLRAPTGPALDGLPPDALPQDGLPLGGLTRLGRGAGDAPAWLGRGEGQGGPVGSNAWVVAGDLTATGAPLLASDPHLAVSAPGPLLQVGLHCRAVSAACPYDVTGFSSAGMPGVLVGHNADIAWGFTKLGADVIDLYVERVRGDTWRSGGRARPVRERVETIEVEGADDIEITVRSTGHGPIVSDVDAALADVAERAPVRRPEPAAPAGTTVSDDPVEYAVALSWTGSTPTPTADAVLALDRAEDWTSFRAALSSFAAPAQSVVYADREGHVGVQATGMVPIRKSGNDGRMPSAGWRPENDWTDESVPFDGLPNVLDPDGGVIVSANQAVTGPDYPYFLTDDWDHGYRAERISTLLEAAGAAGESLSADDLGAIQLDDHTPLGPILTPYLLEADLPGGYYSDGQRLLASWDFHQPADSAAAAYLNVVWRTLLALTFHDELPESLWPDGGQRWVAVLEDLLAEPDDAYWDDIETEARETRDDVVVAAMRAARDELTSREAVRAEEWTWGGLHQLELRSTSMDGRALGGLFGLGGRDVGGSGLSVNATSWDAASGYEVTVAPAMRSVIAVPGPDDEDGPGWDDSRWVDLTGVSGHAFAAHDDDQSELWVAGSTLPWLFSEAAVRAAAEDSLTLLPTPSE